MNRAIRRGVELVFVGGLTAAINFAYLVYAARNMGPREYADFWAALSLLFFSTLLLAPLAPFASHVAAVAVTGGGGADVREFRRWLTRTIALAALVVMPAAALFSRSLARFFHVRSPAVLVAAAAAVCVFAFLAAERGLFQGLGRFREYNINAAVESVVRLAVAVALLAFWPTATSAFVAYIAGLAAAIILFIPMRVPTGGANPQPLDFWVEARVKGIPMLLLLASVGVFQNADSLAVKRWFASTDAAAYAAASAVSRTFSALGAPLWILLVPSVAAAESRRRGVAIGLRICGTFAALSIVLLVIVAVLASPLHIALFGRSFPNAAPLFVPVSGIVILINVSLLLAQTLVGVGRARAVWFVTAFAAIEIAALALYHPGIWQLIALLYALHGTVTALLAVAVARAGWA